MYVYFVYFVLNVKVSGSVIENVRPLMMDSENMLFLKIDFMVRKTSFNAVNRNTEITKLHAGVKI